MEVAEGRWEVGVEVAKGLGGKGVEVTKGQGPIRGGVEVAKG